jgi:D-aminoacyl-tRNA deacylase
LVLLGVEDLDKEEHVKWLSEKFTGMRVFNDTFGIMNLSVKDISGHILAISQFTLKASTKTENRPSFIKFYKS